MTHARGLLSAADAWNRPVGSGQFVGLSPAAMDLRRVAPRHAAEEAGLLHRDRRLVPGDGGARRPAGFRPRSQPAAGERQVAVPAIPRAALRGGALDGAAEMV